MEEGPDGILT